MSVIVRPRLSCVVLGAKMRSDVDSDEEECAWGGAGSLVLDRWFDENIARAVEAWHAGPASLIDDSFRSELFGGGLRRDMGISVYLLDTVVRLERGVRQELCEREVLFRAALSRYVETAYRYRYSCEAVKNLVGAGLSYREVAATVWGSGRDGTMALSGYLESLRRGNWTPKYASLRDFYEGWAAGRKVVVYRSLPLLAGGAMAFSVVDAADEACVAESERFLEAIGRLLSAGLTGKKIAAMAGYETKNGSASIKELYSRIRKGAPSVRRHLVAFYGAYGDWLAGGNGASAPLGVEPGECGVPVTSPGACRRVVLGGEVEGPAEILHYGCPAHHSGDIERHVEGRRELRVSAGTFEWLCAAIDRLRDNGVNGKSIANMLGYSDNSPRYIIRGFITESIYGDEGSSRIARFRRAVYEWDARRKGLGERGVAIERAETKTRDALSLAEIEELYHILRVLAEVPGFEAVWMPILIGRALRLCVPPTQIVVMAGYCSTASVSGRSLRSILRSLAVCRGAVPEKALRLRPGLLSLLSRPDYVEAARICASGEYVSPGMLRARLAAYRSERREEVRRAMEAFAADEANGRSVLVGGEDLCRGSLELSLARLHPASWMRGAAGRLLGQGVSCREISLMAGYPGLCANLEVRRLMCGGEVWRLEGMWKSVRSWERRRATALAQLRRNIEGEEAARRASIGEEERAGLDGVMRSFRGVPGMEPLWIPYAVEVLFLGGASLQAVVKLAGYEPKARETTIRNFLASLRAGPQEYSRRAALFRENLASLEARAAGNGAARARRTAPDR